jgi:hypothetical protein
MTKERFIVGFLCVTALLSSIYAVRQRQWALQLRDQLSVTNKDDVKLMHLLSAAEKESICARFRELGETRIADWIAGQYLETQGNVADLHGVLFKTN